jgi:hypothetical protein
MYVCLWRRAWSSFCQCFMQCTYLQFMSEEKIFLWFMYVSAVFMWILCTRFWGFKWQIVQNFFLHVWPSTYCVCFRMQNFLFHHFHYGLKYFDNCSHYVKDIKTSLAFYKEILLRITMLHCKWSNLSTCTNIISYFP